MPLLISKLNFLEFCLLLSRVAPYYSSLPRICLILSFYWPKSRLLSFHWVLPLFVVFSWYYCAIFLEGGGGALWMTRNHKNWKMAHLNGKFTCSTVKSKKSHHALAKRRSLPLWTIKCCSNQYWTDPWRDFDQ